MFVQLYSSLSPNHCLWLCDYVFDTVNALNACLEKKKRRISTIFADKCFLFFCFRYFLCHLVAPFSFRAFKKIVVDIGREALFKILSVIK